MAGCGGRRTRRKLRLPLALGLRDGVVCLVCHGAGRSEKRAEKGYVWHRPLNRGALGAVVEGAAKSAGGVRADEGAGCVADCVERADELREGREAHRSRWSRPRGRVQVGAPVCLWLCCRKTVQC